MADDNSTEAMLRRLDAELARRSARETAAAKEQAARDANTPGALESFGRGVGSGLTFDWGDDGVAYLQSYLNGKSYRENLAAINERGKLGEEANPWSSGLGEVAGAVAPTALAYLGTGLTGGAAAPAAAGATANLASAGSRLLGTGIRRGATLGALGGAVQGAGEGGPDDRLGGAVRGALMGAGTGAAISAAAPVVGNALNRITRSSDSSAADHVLDALRREGLTPDEALARYRTVFDSPEQRGVATLADMNPRGQVAGELDSVLNRPADDARSLAARLAGRSGTQGERISGNLRREFDVQPGGPRDEIEALRAQITGSASDEASRLYKAAYDFGDVTEPEVRNLLKRLPPSVFREAAEDARFRGVEFPDLIRRGRDGSVDLTRTPTVQDLDLVKRGLDALIERNTDAVTGKMTQTARNAAAAKSALLKRVDAIVPAYAKARSVAGDPLRRLEAIDTGIGAHKLNEFALGQQIDKIGDNRQLRDDLVAGYVGEARRKLGSVDIGNDASKAIGGNPNERANLAAALRAVGPADAPIGRASDSYARLERALDAEKNISANNRKAFNNSATASRQLFTANEKRAAGVIGALDVLTGTGGLLSAAGLGLGALTRSAARSLGAGRDARRTGAIMGLLGGIGENEVAANVGKLSAREAAEAARKSRMANTPVVNGLSRSQIAGLLSGDEEKPKKRRGLLDD